MRYRLARPTIGQEEIAAVTRVLKSGALSMGPLYKKFERAFARKIGTRYAVAVSSGTAGLHLAMIGAGLQAGDEVITTPLSFVASANCILYVGAKPVFADVEPETYNLDPEQIEKKITPRTRAILVVHLFGQPADMTAITKIAKKYRLKIIEDACEAILARHWGNQVGTYGESAVFAFYPNKQMTTGEGGMIVTNNKKKYKLFCSLRNQGRSDDDLKWLVHDRLGYNYRLNELSAALGLEQLKKLDRLIRKRQRIAQTYSKFLKKNSDLVVLPQVKKGNSATWFVYLIRLKAPGVSRDRIIQDLQKVGIQAKPYVPVIHLQKFYREQFGFRPGSYPVAENIARTSIALPFYPGLKENDIRRICQQLISIIKKYVQR